MPLRAAAGSRAGRLYIGGVILAGAVLLGVRLPVMHVEQPLLFLTIAAAAIVISVSKVNLPVAGGSASLSGAYFTDLLALMLLGPDQAMVVAAASAAAQCQVQNLAPTTWYQTAFSASVLVVAMQATGAVSSALGGFHATDPISDLAIVTVAAASVLFLVNSFLVAVVIARTRGASMFETWHREFAWTAPACLVGAATAAVLFQMASHYVWAMLLPVVPLYVPRRLIACTAVA